jgi:hypothetical protein
MVRFTPTLSSEPLENIFIQSGFQLNDRSGKRRFSFGREKPRKSHAGSEGIRMDFVRFFVSAPSASDWRSAARNNYGRAEAVQTVNIIIVDKITLLLFNVAMSATHNCTASCGRKFVTIRIFRAI